MSVNYSEVTELAGEPVSSEQVLRLCVRYGWAAERCQSKDVLEIACGTAPGAGLLKSIAKSFVAGDISEEILDRARRHYGQRVELRQLDAMSLPFPPESLDVVLIFEALYYVPDAQRFAAECARVLRPGGAVLIVNANKDLSDFNPSPHSRVYHGVSELETLFASEGFSTQFWGNVPVTALSIRQKMLRPIKKAVVALNLMPKSMKGKKLLKRLVFGSMTSFPAEITAGMIPRPLPITALNSGAPDRLHKVVLCEARKKS